MSNRIVNLREWDCAVLDDFYLPDLQSKDIAKILSEKGILEIVELKNGLEIKTNSYVGKIIIGDIQFNILPKLNGMPLYKLLRYAYGLRDLKLFNISEHAIDNFSFFDLIIYELLVEAEDLLRKGVEKSYIRREENLCSPRGRIDITKVCNQGGLITDTLPCRYFNRDDNNLLNQALLSGLKLGKALAVDKGLTRKLNRMCRLLEEDIEEIKLTRSILQTAKNSINRLNARYSSVLEITNILFESQGIQLEDGHSRVQLKGYFFDMNVFFETLVGRLLENCYEYSVKNQFTLHDMFIYTPGYNPCRRKSPTPRPDFALMKGSQVVKIFDAKYRDLWEKSLPRDMLYQLAIYAVSGIGDKTATILYPAMSDIPSTQKIDINDPITSSKMATVILKPLNLNRIANILNMDEPLIKYVSEIVS